MSAEPEPTVKQEPEPEGYPESEPEGEPEAEVEPSTWGYFNGTGEPEPLPGAEPEPGFSENVMVVLAVLAVIIIVIGTAGNLLVIVVIAKMKIERTLTEIFLTSLAIADIIVCVFATPLLVVGIIQHQGHTGISYQVEQFLFYFSSVASILNLTAIAVDRYDAVLHSMSRRLKKNNIKWVLLCIWNIAFAAALVIHFIPSRFELLILAPFFSVPLSIMIVCYYRILKTAKQSEKKTMRRELPLKGDKSSSTGSKTDKTVKMVIIVVVVFVLSWIPSIVSRLLKYLVEMSPAQLASMEVSACLIAYAGSALNFIVYACMSRRFQTGVIKMFGCRAFANKVDCTDNKKFGDIGKTMMQDPVPVSNLGTGREGKQPTPVKRNKTSREISENSTEESNA